MIALLALACSRGEIAVDPPSPSENGATDTPPSTAPTVPTTLPCAPDPALSITSASPSTPWHENELQIDVALSAPATVAVACTLASDPSEVHLAEDTATIADHALRIGGLLGAADYDCAVAAVCPATSAPTHFQVHTADPPPDLVEVEATVEAGAGSEYVLFNQSVDCDYQEQRLNVVDRQGRYRWWYATPDNVGPSVEFRYHGGNVFEWGGGWEPNGLGRPREVDLFDGEIYDTADDLPDASGSDFHHDGKRLPDGRLLTLERVGIDAGAPFDGFRIRRIDPATGDVDFDYDSQRLWDDGDLPRGSGGDPWHANWVDIVGDTLYVSLCNLERVIAIDVPTGDYLWNFASGGDFALSDAGGDPLGDDEFTQCQHGLEYTADDHLLVYDNGNSRGYSRVAQYTLDQPARTATLDWTWTEPDWWETTLGDADYLPDGRILVNMGHSDCFSSNPGDRTTIVEIDPATGEKLWQLRYVPRDMTAYRADWADPCGLFANAAVCPAVAARLADLAPVLAP
jgi:hypothetical protein